MSEIVVVAPIGGVWTLGHVESPDVLGSLGDVGSLGGVGSVGLRTWWVNPMGCCPCCGSFGPAAAGPVVSPCPAGGKVEPTLVVPSGFTVVTVPSGVVMVFVPSA
jgi:hypothetical protein